MISRSGVFLPAGCFLIRGGVLYPVCLVDVE